MFLKFGFLLSLKPFPQCLLPTDNQVSLRAFKSLTVALNISIKIKHIQYKISLAAFSNIKQAALANEHMKTTVKRLNEAHVLKPETQKWV